MDLLDGIMARVVSRTKVSSKVVEAFSFMILCLRVNTTPHKGEKLVDNKPWTAALYLHTAAILVRNTKMLQSEVALLKNR